MTTRIILVRHGETEWNDQSRVQGHSDIPMNAKGIRQAELAAIALRDELVAAVLTSDLGRAMETGRIIAEQHQAPLSTHPGIRERCWGVWEGLTMAEIARVDPERHAALRRGEWVTPHGAESWRAMKQRILRTIETFADRHPGKTIVVATHGGTIKAFVSAFLGVRRTGRGSMRISNGGISVVLRRADHWTLETYNSTAHLTDTPESSEPSGKRLIEAAF